MAGAFAIGLAICGMHYSGMRAMMLSPGTDALQFPGDAAGAALARIGVGNALIFTICILVVSYQERLRILRVAHDAQLQAQDAKRMAEQLSAAGRIAASIARELNNPLEAVTNLLYLAEHTEVGEETLAYLHQAQSELQRVAEITTHTLKFYRQQQPASATSLIQLVDSVLILFSKKLETRGMEVEKDWEPGKEVVECRAGEIRQVIANLIRNAIDSMLQGVKLSLALRLIGDSVELDVTDSGTGIPEEARQKLFQPFFTTKGVGGTGLGLSIIAEIFERHSGTLRFQSRTEPPDRGTTFTMVLPKQAKQRGTLGA